ncbi:MAG: CBS domain-containing protein, partial [Alphaproteobacteria bacterium]
QAFGGIWWVVIGLFLRGAAQSELARLTATAVLGGRTVGEIMTRDPVAVPAALSVARLVDEFVYRYFHDSFPVLDDGKLVGIVGVRQLESIPSVNWPITAIRDVMRPADADLLVDPGAPALKVLMQMQKAQTSRLLVAKAGRLVGIVTARDLIQAIELAGRIGKIRDG